ncbi:carbon-nitrogen hydrolase family protein [Dethiosulfovibrio salsuginis]|uniref:Predicted amidohydrolase n=1 Tax=Dethiosulfovibrio salsuginis TaxID=561720 RepID=A0A1X7KNN7_9BACT|nr:carbon-nitrogen hydrolase family protein [Dethiosulfovibrio salsuginis]SMG42993.1 Predicted amidohydrolase [Dethiosulfovibrio salsuginis]
METRKIAIAQMDSGPHKEINLQKMEGMISEAAKQGVSFVAFPETSIVMPATGEDREADSEDIHGPSIARLSEAAKEAGIWVHCGSIPERIEGDKRSHNTSVVISPEGEIAGIYRKIHLFDIDMEGGPSVMESVSYSPGKDVVTVETDIGTLGLSICYDLRFPELFRMLVLKGARILVVPACFTADTGKEHWEPLLRARAIENQCYVLAPAQTGMKPRYRAHGKSLVVDPWGTITACKADGEGLILSEVDMGRVESIRHSVPCLRNRRPDIYGWNL